MAKLDDMVKSEETKGILCPECPANFFFTDYFEQHLGNEHFMHTASEIQKVTGDTPSFEDWISPFIYVEHDPVTAETSTIDEGFDDGDTGKKPFKCDKCSYSTTKKLHLTDHQRTHTCLLYTSPSPRD